MVVKQEFRVNKYLCLKLEDTNTESERDWTVIYVNGEEFAQCHYLLLTISEENFSSINNLDSIDEMEDYLRKDQERNPGILTPEEEFFGHCSNLQAWYEYGYDTRLLHRNLSFPLLKKLTEVGDVQAQKVFKEEIIVRLLSGVNSVIIYLINEGYIDYLSLEEWDTIINDLNISRGGIVKEGIIEVLKTVGTSYERKEKLYEFLKILDRELASHLRFVEFNGEKFFVNNGVLKFHITKDENRLIKNIKEIIGLEKLVNLKELYLWNQNIEEIDGLENLKNLELLNLRGNQIKEIKGLENLDNLRELTIELNQLSEIKGLEKLRNLEYLNLYQNTIKKIEGLENLINLKFLYLGNNQIKEINGVMNLLKLEVLNLNFNKIREIKNIDNLKNLKKLQLIGNPIPEYEYHKIKWKNRKLGYIQNLNPHREN